MVIGCMVRLETSTSAKMNSFQALTKVKMAVVVSPGAVSGRAILKIIPVRERPSIMAASSNSSGMFLKNPRNIQIENGRVIAVFTKIKAVYVSSSCRAFIISNRGMRTITGENICTTRMLMPNRPRPRNLMRAIA